MIAAIEFRGEDDADVAPYRHATASEVLTVQPSGEVGAARAALFTCFRRVMGELGRSKVRRRLHLVAHISAQDLRFRIPQRGGP
jgi:ERCC4-related helicase